MAYSIISQPLELAGSKSPCIFQVKETALYSSAKFKYICDVYINGARVARLKQLPNPGNVAVFDVSKIIDSYVEPTIENQNSTSNMISFLGKNNTAKPFSLNKNTLETVICKFGYEKAADADSDPVVTADVVTATTVYGIPANIPFIQWGVNPDLEETFFPGNDEDLLLTNMPCYLSGESRFSWGEVIPTYGANDWRLMAFYNNGSAERIYVQIFNSSGVKLNTTNDYFANTTGNGGMAYASISADTQRLIYVGVGVQNLNNQSLHTDMRISNHATASYYEVFCANGSGTQGSVKYRFSLEGDACKWKPTTLMWQNRLGTWDSFTFIFKSQKTLPVTRTSYNSIPGNWGEANASGTTFTYQSYERGKTSLGVSSVYNVVANSGYITQRQAEWIKELFTSPNVYLIDNDITLQEAHIEANTSPIARPVVVKSSTFEEKTSVNNRLINYTIELEYANGSNTGI
jgi:hypothetical protein